MSKTMFHEHKTVRLFVNGVRGMFSPVSLRESRLSRLNEVSDGQALASDWNTIGMEIRKAMRDYEGSTKR